MNHLRRLATILAKVQLMERLSGGAQGTQGRTVINSRVGWVVPQGRYCPLLACSRLTSSKPNGGYTTLIHPRVRIDSDESNEQAKLCKLYKTLSFLEVFLQLHPSVFISFQLILDIFQAFSNDRQVLGCCAGYQLVF